jgi:predicted nuclease of predicted toxin-antitoxin system
MAERPRLKFLTDNCVPDSVGKVLSEAGHEVILLRDILPTNSADPLVASVAEINGAILVSFDRDFKALAPRIGIGQQRFRRLRRIGFRCAEPEAAHRIQVALALIEFEWETAQSASDKRMIVEIGPTYIRTVRKTPRLSASPICRSHTGDNGV